MNSLQYKQSQLKYLCTLIGCKPDELDYIINNIDDYYKEWFEQKIDKKTGDFKTFKDGTIKKRVIRPSLKRLKLLQSTIKKKILIPIVLPDNIHGGVAGKSNITNAKPHQGNKYKFTTDLKEFYPNIRHKDIYSTFLQLGFSNHVSHWLTKLTSWKYELPQGTHTSTHIANLVFLKTDKALIELCNSHKITYTRYVDDLTFSSQKDFILIISQILKIVIDNGFKINYRKTTYKGRQTVTGIEVFNNYIDAPIKIKAEVAREKTSDSKSKPYSVYLKNIRKTNKNTKGMAK